MNPLLKNRTWTQVAWRVLAALAACAALHGAARAAGGDAIWQFVDADGVLHVGNAAATNQAASGPPPRPVPDFVARRRVVWLDLTPVPQAQRSTQWNAVPTPVAPWARPWGRLAAAAAASGITTALPGLGAALPASLPPGLKSARFASVKAHLDAAAAQHAVEPALLYAVAAAESAFNVHAVSPKGALGLMQLMPATAGRYGVAAPFTLEGRQAILDPATNAWVGSRYLADLLRMFDGDTPLAVAAYNAGEGAVARYGRQIPPYPETRLYVERVMRYYEALISQ
ncbi:MAG: lytic transglycosylase domain-containing protein [Burkholderiaceae bacterium]|jgi:soluble lytic murein transglycosylase-like protein|nr:lytic transglycosylase domain-containing protein [Burkholderiaceae bacterium]